MAMRVLVYVHGHPRLKPGGSEVAAYALYRALAAEADVEAFFLAAAPDEQFGGQLALHQLDGEGREFLLPRLVANDFYFLASDRAGVKAQLFALIERLGIEVLHLHHFLGIGVDTVIQLRNRFPALRLVFTAHEYLSLCARDGQMVRAPANELCRMATPLGCAVCLPHGRALDFEVRREWFRAFFDSLQAVLAPSRFLAGRLAEHGVPEDRLGTIENIHPHAAAYDRAPQPATATVRRFGFFAQINEYKGTHVLLDAAEQLLLRESPVEIHVFGAFTGGKAFREQIARRLEALQGIVLYHGGYLPDGILGLMRQVDWVVMPSIWWENAPTVIEEALIAGRPLLVSDIGGMREKVRHGIEGLHFPVGDAAALAETIQQVAGDRALWDRLVAGRRGVADARDIVQRHLAVYRRAD